MNAIRSLLLSSLTAVAGAQDVHLSQLDPQQPTADDLLVNVPIHTAAPDHGIAYGTWAAGRAYKASFHDGMTFVPYLGAEYPHNQPWSWRTTQVRRGNTELLDSGEVARHWHDDYRYEYRFGGFAECYDVRSDGLEQTFVFAECAGQGDLVIEGTIDTALTTANVGPAHRNLVFRDHNDTAIVEYGAAWVVDAAGNKIQIATSFGDGRVRLRVPHAWLERAHFPIIVDPLLGTAQVTSSSVSIRETAIGHEHETGTFRTMVMFARSASSVDDDVLGIITNDSFSANVSIFSDVSSSWDSDSPSVAYVGGANRWVMVWRRYFYNSPIEWSGIRGHVHVRGSTLLSTSVATLTTPVNHNDWRPKVGGIESGGAGTRALVVFQREDNSSTNGDFANSLNSEIWAARFDPTVANGSFDPASSVAASLFRDYERPDVTQVSEGIQWVCVYQGMLLGVFNVDWEVHARRIIANGAVDPTTWNSAINLDTARHALGPKITGSEGRYAVACATVDMASVPSTLSTVGKDVRIERIEWSTAPTQVPTSTHGPAIVSSDPARIFELGDIAMDYDDLSHVALTWRLHLTPLSSGNYGAVTGFTGNVTEGPYQVYVQSGHTVAVPAITHSPTSSGFLHCFGVFQGGPSIVAGRPWQYNTATPWSTDGTGCSAAAISWRGNQQIGSELSGIDVTGAAAGTAHVLGLSLIPNNLPVTIPGVGSGCHLLINTVVGYLGAFDFQVGPNPSWTLPLPENLGPMTVHFQDWILTGTSLESTKRLTVPLVK